MKTERLTLREIVQFISRDQMFELSKYELAISHSHITFIDIIPKITDFVSEKDELSRICHSTIMIASSTSGQNHLHQHMQCVRRSSKIIRELYFPNFPAHSLTVQTSLKSLQFSNGLDNVHDVFLKRKQVEVIKTGWPHGITIQVSYLDVYKMWIISDGRCSRLIQQATYLLNQQTEGKDQLDLIANCWVNLVKKSNSRAHIEDKLKKVTISGKIIKHFKQILFYSVVQNENGNDIDPFEAREYLQQVGLKFVSIKSLGMFTLQENLLSVLMKTIKSTRLEFSQLSSLAHGRAKIHFVKNDGFFLDGGNISTAEDILLSSMKIIVSKNMKFQQMKHQINNVILALKNQLPFPQRSYKCLFDNIVKLVQVLQLSSAQIQQQWFKIPKLCLYLLSKRLSIQNYARLYYQPQYLQQICQIPFQTFGPLQCKVHLIYCFFHPSVDLKNAVANKIKQLFQSIGISILILKDINYLQQKSLQQTIIGQSNIQNFFILSILSINEIKNLQSSLNDQKADRYFKFNILNESFKGETIINSNSFPFSMTSIINSYLEVLTQIKNGSRIEERVEELQKVTARINSFQSCEVMNLKNKFPIALQDFNEAKQLRQAIQNVLVKNQKNAYLALILKLQKYINPILIQYKLLDHEVTNIIKKSYSSIRTICIKKQ